jgi:hypothetical protein
MKEIVKIFVLILSISLFGCTEDTDLPTDVDPVEKFLGTWNVSDNALKINYEVNIVKSTSNSSMVILNNFADSGDAAEGLVAGNSIVVSYQEVGQNWYINGNGTYTSASRLDFNYSLDIGGSQENRRAVFSH